MNEAKGIVIFGADTFARLAAHNLQKMAGRRVTAFTVDDAFLPKDTFESLPVYAFSQVGEACPPENHDMLLPLGYGRINGFRRERFEQAKAMHYQLANFVSPQACVLTDALIGENVLIFEQAILQPYVELGVNIIIRSGANIGHHSIIGDHSFIASGAVTGGNVTMGEQCFIGLGAIIRDNITVADRCFIGAGAVVVKDTEPDCVYIGNPARKINKTSLEVTS